MGSIDPSAQLESAREHINEQACEGRSRLEGMPLGIESYREMNLRDRAALTFPLVERFGTSTNGTKIMHSVEFDIGSPVARGVESWVSAEHIVRKGDRPSPVVSFRLIAGLRGLEGSRDALDFGALYRLGGHGMCVVVPNIIFDGSRYQITPLDAPEATDFVRAMDALNEDLVVNKVKPLFCAIGDTGIAGCEED